MGSHNLRHDKTCQNCGGEVTDRFCATCGQENTETRQSSGYLFTHFFEDFTHYDNAFWRTIKYLLFRPARLTTEYLSGRRMSYVPPVRLYIFISFTAFFLMSVLPDGDDYTAMTEAQIKQQALENKTEGSPFTGSNPKGYLSMGSDTISYSAKNDTFQVGNYKSVRELDSAQNALPKNKRFSRARYWLEKKLAHLNTENRSRKDFSERASEAILHNLPKALFLYMPFFAFGLWIFHGKKRWLYFDHGIFTLHYFSFILFTLSISLIINCASSFIDVTLNTLLTGLLAIGLIPWWIFYFFRSHRRFYGESKLISRTKSFILLLINIAFITAFMVGLFLISILTLN